MVAFCALVPFARIPSPRIEAFNPIFESTLALNNLVTTSLLLVAFRRSRLRAVLCLASGYLFTALMAAPLLLTFPGVFSSSDPHAVDPQTSAWLDTFRNVGFPLFVICYALLRRYDVATGRLHTGARASVIWAAAGVVAGTCLLSLVASAGYPLLPRLRLGDSYTTAMMALNIPVCLTCFAAAILLASRPPYSILDLWLIVVVLAWMFDGALSTVLNAGHSTSAFMPAAFAACWLRASCRSFSLLRQAAFTAASIRP